jgi:hypothetical protein
MKVCPGLGGTGVRLPGAVDLEVSNPGFGISDRRIPSILDPIFAFDQPGWSF